MELRLLTGESDRKIFAERVEQVRAKHGNGFKERSRSRLAEIHLSFGNLYALFENDGDPAERMIAGLMMHDLEMFPQTCPRPDLSHLPPRSVLEVGELWSCSMGAGTLARAGAAIMAGLLDARALLAYLGAKPFDGTAFYRGIGFVNVGEPVEYPYLETLNGEPIWAQPMILEGQGLERLTRVFARLIIEIHDNNQVVRFTNFMRQKSEGSVHVTARNGFFVPAPAAMERVAEVASVQL